MRPVSTFFKLLLISFVVGVGLSALNITPRRLIENFGATIRDVYNMFASIIEWGLKYILVGAVIVVPIWLVAKALQRLADRRKAK